MRWGNASLLRQKITMVKLHELAVHLTVLERPGVFRSECPEGGILSISGLGHVKRPVLS